MHDGEPWKKLARIRARLKTGRSTIKECSRADSDEGDDASSRQPVKYVVDSGRIASLQVSDFDTVQKEWYARFHGRHMPCSVDALFIDEGGVFYAIEFKSGGANSANLVRKIHETIMGCMENLFEEGSTFSKHEFYRANMIYLVVASELDSPSQKTLFRTFLKYERPWEHPDFPDRWKLKPLEDIVVKRVFTVPPTMFPRLAKAYQWTT